MRAPAMSSRAPLLALVVVALPVTGCAAAKSDPPLVGVDENAPGDRSSESLTGDVPVGSTLVTTTNLNLRDGASTAHAILEVIPSGASVTAVDASPQSGWYHVRYAGADGWSIGTYLKRSSSGSGSGSGSGPESVSWSCPGTWGTTQASDGRYFLTAFGCWVDASGVAHGDPGDDCIPGCLSQAKAQGLCASSDTGKACEERVTWYVADAGRFGCGARVKITNPASGKSVVGVALDYGPACWVERNVSEGVLDASGRIDRYLFGSDMGASDRAAVHVEAVDASTPLGPQ